MRVPLLNFGGGGGGGVGPEILLLDFEGRPRVPLLHFRAERGGSPGSLGPGPTITPCLMFVNTHFTYLTYAYLKM